MFGNDLMIKKYPYMGYSQNILEYFAIIGYQENFIPTVINSINSKKKILSYYFNFSYIKYRFWYNR